MDLFFFTSLKQCFISTQHLKVSLYICLGTWAHAIVQMVFYYYHGVFFINLSPLRKIFSPKNHLRDTGHRLIGTTKGMKGRTDLNVFSVFGEVSVLPLITT